MSKIRVLYFAGVKDITLKDFEDISLPQKKITVIELSNLLIAKYGPKFEEILSTSMYAVDMEYVDKEDESRTLVKNASEVAIIPPVSGG
ncbi:unnamed protein product [Mucor hiemalis]